MWQLSPVPGKRNSAQLYRHTETVVGSFGTCVYPVQILSDHRVNSLVGIRIIRSDIYSRKFRCQAKGPSVSQKCHSSFREPTFWKIPLNRKP